MGPLAIAITRDDDKEWCPHVSVTFEASADPPAFTGLPADYRLTTVSVGLPSDAVVAQLRGGSCVEASAVEHFDWRGGEQCGQVALSIRRTRLGLHGAGRNGRKHTTYSEPCAVTWLSARALTVRVGEGDSQWTMRLGTGAPLPVGYTPSRENRVNYYGEVKRVVTTHGHWHVQLGEGSLPPRVVDAVARPTRAMVRRALGMQALPFTPAVLPPVPPQSVIPSEPEPPQSDLLDQWGCGACTLLNPETVTLCALCQSPRPLAPGQWKCGACTYVNTAPACEMCEAARPAEPPAQERQPLAPWQGAAVGQKTNI